MEEGERKRDNGGEKWKGQEEEEMNGVVGYDSAL